MATHTGEALYSCVNCGTTFKSKANMFHHRRRFHKAEWALDCTKPPPPVKEEQAEEFPTPAAAAALT